VAGVYFEQVHGNIFMVVWLPYTIMPILDYVLPVDNSNVKAGRVRVLEQDSRYMIPLYCVFVMDVGVLIWFMHRVAIGEIGVTLGNLMLYAFCSAQSGGLNAVIGHELIHRRYIVHKIVGTLSYAKMMYGHYFIQHVRSHHKKVATPEDPSTALLDENLFQFWIRTVPAGFVEVWEYEVARLKQAGSTAAWEFLLYNRMFTFMCGQLAWLGLCYWVFGGRAVAFHLLHSLFVVLMFEAVNYIEHYGLMRKKLDLLNPVSAYESVKVIHSWNAPHVISNYLLFKLQRHSDHHANAYKPYQILESLQDSPMLPYGYTVCLMLVLNPPLWKKICNPISIATNNGTKMPEDVQQENEKYILGTLCVTALVLTYINFFVIGFK
jgi:alkane 1-monooxygenase